MARVSRNFATMGEAADLPNLAAVKAYKGKAGEPIFDRARLRMQDGINPGGIPLVICTRFEVRANATILAGHALVAVVQLNASIVLSLPPASVYEPGQPLYVADETGLCSYDNNLTITVSANGPDQISGQPAIVMGSPFQKLTFHCNGSNLWTY